MHICDACRLIKRCNDFGAGGVPVAVGELADGLFVDLNTVPKKYEGLDGKMCIRDRAAADENHAHGQRAGQVEDRAQGHGDERHDDEVSYGADDDHQRLGQDALEVVQRQGQAHAEQHDAQHVAGVRLAPQAGGRHEVVEDGPDDDDDRKPLGQPICKG